MLKTATRGRDAGCERRDRCDQQRGELARARRGRDRAPSGGSGRAARRCSARRRRRGRRSRAPPSTSASSSIVRPAIGVLQHRRAESRRARASGRAGRRPTARSGSRCGRRSRPPRPCSEARSRAPARSSRIASVSAPVSAETGLIVMLPQSLYQTSMRTSALGLGLKPALASAAQTASTRAEAPPAARRRSVARRCCGARARARGSTPRGGRRSRGRCSSGSRASRAPPGSTLASGACSGMAAGRSHQGTPFIAGRRTVARAEQRRDRARDDGQRRRLDGEDDEVLRAERRRVVARLDAAPRTIRARSRRAGPSARTRGERLAARERRDVVAGAGEARRDQPADRAEADDGDLHRPPRFERRTNPHD